MCQPPVEEAPTQEKMEQLQRRSRQNVAAGKNSIGHSHPTSPASTAEENLRLGTLYGSLSLALLVMSFSLTMPHYQSLRDELQCDSMCLGSMTSARSTLALIGSALVGRLSDVDNSFLARTIGGGSGRRACLYVGSASSIAGLIIAATMISIKGMWLSMIPGALLQQNFSVFKALLADYHEAIQAASEANSDDNDENAAKKEQTLAAARAGSVGKLGMSVGLAFMVGPVAGATVVKSFEQASALAVVAAIFSALLIAKLPMVSRAGPKKEVEMKEDTGGTDGILSFLNVKAARSPAAIFLMIVRVCMALAYHIFFTIWTVSLKARFDFGPADHGKFMSFIGLTYALSQGLVAKRVTKSLGSRGKVRVILLCCMALGAGRYFAFQTKSLVAVYIMFGFVVTSLGVVNTIITADASRLAPSDEIGGLFGVLEAVERSAGMVGPVLGGMLAYIHPVTAPLLSVVGLYALIFLLVLFGYQRIVLGESTCTDKKNEIHKNVPSKSEKIESKVASPATTLTSNSVEDTKKTT